MLNIGIGVESPAPLAAYIKTGYRWFSPDNRHTKTPFGHVSVVPLMCACVLFQETSHGWWLVEHTLPERTELGKRGTTTARDPLHVHRQEYP